MERRLLTTLSDKLVELVQSSVEESFRGLAATPTIENANSEIRPTSPSRATEGQNRPYERNLNNRNDNAAVNNAGSPISHRSIGSDLNNRPDKVVQILNGWKLKYSGVGVSVDNFIYRVEALTHQTLEGNFAILCRNASVLFEGKAYEFYWRYHKSVSRVQWDMLCFALRTQFREERDDVDVEELIRNRKQKTNESFDSFYDTISGLVDQLEVPWPARKLVRVLKNNLRPEIRHEILNVEIRTVQELRETCRRREVFLDEVKKIHGYAKASPFRREISEISQDPKERSEQEAETELEIEAFSLVCWNCRKEGHRYQDCLSERRVFCYGCGTPNTYKPSCAKCTKNSKAGTSRSPFRQTPSSALRNQVATVE